MNMFYRQLYLLPAWFNVHTPTTVILNPGEIVNNRSKQYWDKQAPEDETPHARIVRVRETLFKKVYNKMGFEWYGKDLEVPQSTEENRHVAQYYYFVAGRTIKLEDFPTVAGDSLLPLPEDRMLPPVESPERPAASSSPQEGEGKLPGPLRKVARKKIQASLDIGDAKATNGQERQRPAFPHDVATLIRPLLPVSHPLGFLRNKLRVFPGGPITIWGHKLSSSDDDDEDDNVKFAFNHIHWISVIYKYLRSDPPTDKDLDRLDPANVMVWVLQHMTVDRQASFINFILEHSDTEEDQNLMQLEGARLIRVAVDCMPLPAVLGNPTDNYSLEKANTNWNIMLKDVAGGGPHTVASMQRI